MFLEGVASLFQMIFLPGFLFLKTFKLTTNFLKTFIFSFALSLLVNYVMAICLVALKIYTAPWVYLLFFVEIACVLFLYKSSLPSFLSTNFFLALKKNFQNGVTTLKTVALNIPLPGFGNHSFIASSIVISIALLCIGWVLSLFLANMLSLTVFYHTDDIASWNIWAIQWSEGVFFPRAGYYAQLIPINLSIPYVFMGAPLQFFPNMVMPLFLLNILLAMLDLGLSQTSISYFIGIIAMTFLSHNSLGSLISAGYADIPVALMAFLSVYCLLVLRNNNDIQVIKKYLLLGGIFAVTAAVTKQAGLFIAIQYPLLSYLLVVRQSKPFFPIKEWFKRMGIYLLLFLSIVCSFYFYKKLQIIKGLDGSEIAYVSSEIYRGVGKVTRFLESSERFLTYNVFNLDFIRGDIRLFALLLAFLIYGFLIFYALKNILYRFVILLIVLPHYLIWSVFFCYDIRNCVLIFPFYSLGLGVGMEQIALLKKGFLYSTLWHFANGVKKIKVATVLLLALSLLIIFNMRYPSQYLLERQLLLNAKLIGGPSLNKALLEYDKKIGIKKTVLSNYFFPNILLLKHISCCSADFTDNTKQEESFLNYKKYISREDIGYILISNNSEISVLRNIDEQLKAGAFELIFEKDDHRFIKIK